MKLSQSLTVLAFVAAVAPSAIGSTLTAGEIGYSDQPVRSTASRADVQAEYQRFRAHPALADGIVFLQGEAGYVPVTQGQSEDRHINGNTHMMGSNAASGARTAPSRLTENERRAYREQ